MFFSVVLIAIGIALILNAMGLLSGSFWGIFWGIVFLAVGIKMLKKGGCPMCGMHSWSKMGGKMGDCCGHKHEQE